MVSFGLLWRFSEDPNVRHDPILHIHTERKEKTSRASKFHLAKTCVLRAKLFTDSIKVARLEKLIYLRERCSVFRKIIKCVSFFVFCLGT